MSTLEQLRRIWRRIESLNSTCRDLYRAAIDASRRGDADGLNSAIRQYRDKQSRIGGLIEAMQALLAGNPSASYRHNEDLIGTVKYLEERESSLRVVLPSRRHHQKEGA